jgi:hypothetical protein
MLCYKIDDLYPAPGKSWYAGIWYGTVKGTSVVWTSLAAYHANIISRRKNIVVRPTHTPRNK